MHGDEARRTAHQLHNADTVGNGTARLGLGTHNGVLGLLHRGSEAERAVNEIHIVVNGLGNAHYSDVFVTCKAGLRDDLRCPVGTITTNNVQLADVVLLQEADDHVDVKATARRAQDRTSLVMNVEHRLQSEFDGLGASLAAEARKSTSVQIQ